MTRVARPGLVLLCLTLALPAARAEAGTGPRLAESRRKPPVAETEQVSAVVVPGLLLVSVAAPKPFRDDGRVHDQADPLTVRVRDTRGGSPGWSLRGIAREFVEQGGDPVRSEAVRWSARVVDSGGAVTVTPFGVGTPVDGDPGSASRQLASTAAGTSFGSAVLDVRLGVPLSSKDALFSGEVTFTVL